MTLMDTRWKLTPATPDVLVQGPTDGKQAERPIDSEEEFLASEVDRLTDALNTLAERHARLIATARGAVRLGDVDLVAQALAGLGFTPPADANPYDLIDTPPIAAVLEQVNR